MKGFREPEDFGKDRKLINEILVAALSHYGYPFDIATGGRENQKVSDPLYMLQHAPGLVPIFRIAALVKKGKLSEVEEGWISRFLDGLQHVLVLAHDGDEMARSQLKVIDKLIFPRTYELPKTVIEELVEHHHTRPSLARGWKLRELIGAVSWVVKPVRESAKSILDGAIQLREESKTENHTIYDQITKQRVSSYKLAKKYWTRGVTLKTLAIRIYLEELQKQGFEGIDERSLKRDLKVVEDWEKTLPREERNWGVLVVTPGKENVHLPVGEYSEGWKKRKRGRQQK